MEARILKEYNGLAIQLTLNESDRSPESELLREFIRQHRESHLVLIPTGSYYGGTIQPGMHVAWWTIRKACTRPTRWREWLAFVRRKTFSLERP